jgi:hypothetical protein
LHRALHSVAVDDQVDAQPLVLTNQSISGVQRNRTVVYVATEGNTVYAIDASGGILLHEEEFRSARIEVGVRQLQLQYCSRRDQLNACH